MDLTQNKLTKAEWKSIEIPVSDAEKSILALIEAGYQNLDIKYNEHSSILSSMKITYSKEIEKYIYIKYFKKEISDMVSNSSFPFDDMVENTIKTPKKADLLRINNMDHTLNNIRHRIFEYNQLDFCKELLKKKIPFYLYTLIQMKKSTISNVNKYVSDFIDKLIDFFEKNTSNIIQDIFHNLYDIIEKNTNILKYEDNALYEHQKQLFQVFKHSQDLKTLVLYTSATGSGKTISPIGLSIGNRIIFICAARHIGLQLAKSAISMQKCVAFAFGCESANDIRLHYYSAVEFVKNKKSGSIAKVDNSDGSKVQIMICDIASYLIAMHYMLSFNLESNLIFYWDEPTITLDQEFHPLHGIIRKNWNENKISKVVLSSATLPKEDDIREILHDFRVKFDGAEIHTISAFDCKKTISLLNSKGECVLPHLLFSEYSDIIACVQHCNEHKSLLRYLDLQELVRFIEYIYSHQLVESAYNLENSFSKISELTLNNVKLYYLEILKHIAPKDWSQVFLQNRAIFNKLPTKCSGIYFTTQHAYTLTDGPSIYIAEDVCKVGQFFVQNTIIPTKVFDSILDKININNSIQQKMDSLMKSLDDTLGKESEKDKKMEKEAFSNEAKKIITSIEHLRADINVIVMEHKFVPNTRQHQEIWHPQHIVTNAFVPIIEEVVIREIMELHLTNQMKLLLLLGIGVFDAGNSNVHYMEIMKKMASEQKLFIIIASSDYIYGTNYQLCHGIIGKDIINMTQQKTIQALGRIGRSNIQQEYTVRFRDDQVLSNLFLPSSANIERDNICALFSNSNLSFFV